MIKLKNKAKKKMSIITKVTMCMVMIFSCMSSAISNAFALTQTLSKNAWLSGDVMWISADDIMTYYGEWEDDEGRDGRQVAASSGYVNKNIWVLGDSYSYCIEPHINMSGSPLIYEDTDTYEVLRNTNRDGHTSTKNEKLRFLSVLLGLAPSTGASASNYNENIKSLAAQALVWEIVSGERYGNFEKVDPKGRWTSFGDIFQFKNASSQALYEQYYNDFVTKIQTYYLLPSFHDTTITLDTYNNGKWSTTVTDKNNVLDYYDFSVSGYSFSKSGKQLTISTAIGSTSTTKGNIIWNQDVFHTCAPVFWSVGDGIQRMCTVGEVEDPIQRSYLSLKIGVGNVEITKEDNYGNTVAGAQFKISYNADMSSPIGTYTTGSDGKVAVEGLKVGTVYIQEVSIPDSLILDSTIRSVSVTAGQTAVYTATNTLKANLKIAKKDSKGNSIAGAQFKISYSSDMSNPIGTYTTGNDGTVTVSQLMPQTIYIQEISVPSHLVLDSTVHSIDLISGETASYTATNSWKQGYIQVTKKDAETGKVVQKAGTVFDIYNSDDVKVASITTNSKGIAKSGLLDYGTYYVREKTAPDKYTVTVEVSENVGVVENGKTYQIAVSNTSVKGTVNLSKEDSYTGKIPQGDNGTLEGAVYGIYARNPILDPADDSVLFNRDVLVSTMTTNSEGNASQTGLYLGDYYLKEISPSYGYNLDETEYDFSLTYANQNTGVIVHNQTVKERVISQAFSIIKISSDEAGEADLLKGAEFTIKSQADIDKYGSWEEAPVAKNAQGETASVMVTDEKGYAVSDRLSIGTYVVRETKTPDDKYSVADFTVTVSEDSAEPQAYRVFNDTTFMSVLKIVKKDAETGKTVQVAGAKFKIKNLDTNEYFGYWNWNILDGFYTDTWTTNDQGYIQTAEVLKPGHYQLEEIKAPDGYLLNEAPVEFTVSSNVAYETLSDKKTPVITVEYEDVSVKGQITVEKIGEVLTGYENGQFIYETRSLAGMKVQILAKENIMDPSNDGSVLYKAGSVVETLTTDSNGKAISKELPLGTYEIVEVEAPNGFVLNTEKQTAELKYKDQTTAVVLENVKIENDRQKVELNVLKKDANEDKVLSGAEFTLYAKADIKNTDGQVIVQKDEVIAKAVSDANGTAEFDIDLPLDNSFYIRETKAPVGYASTDTVHELTTSYMGQNTATVKVEKTFENKQITVEVSKTDTEGHAVEGCLLAVYPVVNGEIQYGEAFDTWYSGTEPHMIQGLEINKEYALVEKNPADGYTTAETVYFTVEDTAEVQKVAMANKLSEVEVAKIGEAGENVEGSTLAVYPLDDNDQPLLGECFETWVTDGTNHTVRGLTVHQKYMLRELVAPFDDGYVTAKDVIFTVEDTLETQYVEMKDDYTKVQISKTDITTGEPVAGAELKIIPVLEDGTLDEGAVFETWITGEEPHYIERIPVGKYVLRETLAQASELGYVTAEDVIFEVEDTGAIQKVEMQDDYTKVQISKTDTEGHAVEGAVMTVVPIDENGEAMYGSSFDTWITDSEVHEIEYIPVGQYLLVELSAPEGYVKALPVQFEVKDTGDVQKFEMIEKQVIISKTDFVDGQPVTGAELTITDKETGKIIDQWITSDEPHYASGLEEGRTYILTETMTPNGYYTAESVKFVVTQDKEEQKVEMKDAPILTDIQVNKIDSHTKEAIKSKDFVFGLYADESCTELILKVYGNVEDGTATFHQLRYGTYYIKEIETPKGYKLSDEVKKVVIDDDLEGVGHVYSFAYENTLLPTTVVYTGDANDIFSLTSLAGLSLVSAFMLLKKKKEDK